MYGLIHSCTLYNLHRITITYVGCLDAYKKIPAYRPIFFSVRCRKQIYLSLMTIRGQVGSFIMEINVSWQNWRRRVASLIGLISHVFETLFRKLMLYKVVSSPIAQLDQKIHSKLCFALYNYCIISFYNTLR